MTDNDSPKSLQDYTASTIKWIIVVILITIAGSNIVRTGYAIEKATTEGYEPDAIFLLGLYLFAATILFAFTRTMLLGCIFLSLWFGGAVATHILDKDPWYIVVLPIIAVSLVWTALILRKGCFQKLLNVNSSSI